MSWYLKLTARSVKNYSKQIKNRKFVLWVSKRKIAFLVLIFPHFPVNKSSSVWFDEWLVTSSFAFVNSFHSEKCWVKLSKYRWKKNHENVLMLSGFDKDSTCMKNYTERFSRRLCWPVCSHLIFITFFPATAAEFCHQRQREVERKRCRSYRQTDAEQKTLSAVGKPQRSRRNQQSARKRKCHLLNSFSRNKASQTLSIYGLHSGSKETKIVSISREAIRLWNPSGCGCIYKLYAHSNRFNDFPELIVYVYA